MKQSPVYAPETRQKGQILHLVNEACAFLNMKAKRSLNFHRRCSPVPLLSKRRNSRAQNFKPLRPCLQYFPNSNRNLAFRTVRIAMWGQTCQKRGKVNEKGTCLFCSCDSTTSHPGDHRCPSGPKHWCPCPRDHIGIPPLTRERGARVIIWP